MTSTWIFSSLVFLFLSIGLLVSLKFLLSKLSFFQKDQQEKVQTFWGQMLSQLQSNRMELQTGLFQNTQSLEQRFVNLDLKVEKKLGEIQKEVTQKLDKNFADSFSYYEKVQNHLKLASEQLVNINRLGGSILDLHNLLKLPHLRGGFGEATLERILSDLMPQHAYELQYQLPTTQERVDAIIKYPSCVLPIDSKFPREQILSLFEENQPELLEKARKQLTDVIKIQAKKIKEKYIRPDLGTLDMALLFVPSETLYFEVIRNVRLMMELTQLKVFVVSPNTLSIMIHAINMARDYYEMTKGLEKTILEIKKAERHLDLFEKKFGEAGSQLRRSLEAFDVAQTHLNRYHGAIGKWSEQEAELQKEVPGKEASELSV